MNEINLEERFDGHYDFWNKSRMDFIANYLGNDFFNKKTVLDIAGGKGHMSKLFLEQGASTVDIIEGRKTNFSSNFNYTLSNLEYDLNTPLKSYDIVVNFGILYHIANWEMFLLRSILKTKKTLLLETEVLDNDTLETFYKLENFIQYDQAVTGLGSKPTEFAIESFLNKIPNIKFTKCNSGDLNASFHKYNWENKYNFNYEDGLRRFYVIEVEKVNFIKKLKYQIYLLKLKLAISKNKIFDLLINNLMQSKKNEKLLQQILLELHQLKISKGDKND